MSQSKKKKKKSSILPIFLMLIIISCIGYFVANKESTKETYKIKASGGFGGYRESFINLTGDAAEEKKIHLSDDYWTGGKFK